MTIYIYNYKLVPLNVQDMIMALSYGTDPESPRSVRDKTSMFHLKPCVAFRDKAKKKTLSNNNVKCRKRFIGYSKINCVTNYTTTVKYCKLINGLT